MKTTRCLVYAEEYGTIDIEVEVTPLGEELHWRECEISYFDGFPTINYGEWEEPIPLKYGTATSAEEMMLCVIYDGIKDDDLSALTWVTLAEY